MTTISSILLALAPTTILADTAADYVPPPLVIRTTTTTPETSAVGNVASTSTSPPATTITTAAAPSITASPVQTVSAAAYDPAACSFGSNAYCILSGAPVVTSGLVAVATGIPPRRSGESYEVHYKQCALACRPGRLRQLRARPAGSGLLGLLFAVATGIAPNTAGDYDFEPAYQRCASICARIAGCQGYSLDRRDAAGWTCNFHGMPVRPYLASQTFSVNNRAVVRMSMLCYDCPAPGPWPLVVSSASSSASSSPKTSTIPSETAAAAPQTTTTPTSSAPRAGATRGSRPRAGAACTRPTCGPPSAGARTGTTPWTSPGALAAPRAWPSGTCHCRPVAAAVAV